PAWTGAEQTAAVPGSRMIGQSSTVPLGCEPKAGPWAGARKAMLRPALFGLDLKRAVRDDLRCEAADHARLLPDRGPPTGRLLRFLGHDKLRIAAHKSGAQA